VTAYPETVAFRVRWHVYGVGQKEALTLAADAQTAEHSRLLPWAYLAALGFGISVALSVAITLELFDSAAAIGGLVGAIAGPTVAVARSLVRAEAVPRPTLARFLRATCAVTFAAVGLLAAHWLWVTDPVIDLAGASPLPHGTEFSTYFEGGYECAGSRYALGRRSYGPADDRHTDAVVWTQTGENRWSEPPWDPENRGGVGAAAHGGNASRAFSGGICHDDVGYAFGWDDVLDAEGNSDGAIWVADDSDGPWVRLPTDTEFGGSGSQSVVALSVEGGASGSDEWRVLWTDNAAGSLTLKCSSNNLESWTTSNSIVPEELADVVAAGVHNGRFVGLVHAADQNRLITSTDCRSWSAVEVAGWMSLQAVSSVSFVGDRWFFAGSVQTDAGDRPYLVQTQGEALDGFQRVDASEIEGHAGIMAIVQCNEASSFVVAYNFNNDEDSDDAYSLEDFVAPIRFVRAEAIALPLVGEVYRDGELNAISG